jgi:hypothetical protein
VNTTLSDRAALHLGLALITWSRRPRATTPEPNRDELASRREALAARTVRENQWQLALYQSQLRR